MARNLDFVKIDRLAQTRKISRQTIASARQKGWTGGEILDMMEYDTDIEEGLPAVAQLKCLVRG